MRSDTVKINARRTKRSLRWFAGALAVATPSIALAVSSVAPPQRIANEELQRFISAANYSTWCGTSAQAAREMRVTPTTDPKALHAVMAANITECANTPYAQQRAAVWNTAVFGAAAAALLAARHEPPNRALRDAMHAKTWAAELVSFAQTPVVGRSTNTPSAYRTNAGRIERDADALIAALMAAAPGAAASKDNLPDSIPEPGGGGGQR